MKLKSENKKGLTNTASKQDDIVIERGIRNLIELIGDTPNRKELIKTPSRFTEGMKKLLSGYKIAADDIIDSFIEQDIEDIIVLKDISFTSVCEHHLLPFFGKISIGYLPNGKLVGIGKIIQIIEAFTKRLQVQERLSQEIAETIHNSLLSPQGVIISIKATHLCANVYSNSAIDSSLVTTFCTGAFKEEDALKDSFFQKILQL